MWGFAWDWNVEKFVENLGRREGEIRGVLRRLFCSQSLKKLPTPGPRENGQTMGFFYPDHSEKSQFFGVMLYYKCPQKRGQKFHNKQDKPLQIFLSVYQVCYNKDVKRTGKRHKLTNRQKFSHSTCKGAIMKMSAGQTCKAL